MRNLFICHTQAHLILSSGLALGRFKDDENQLVLFKDFNLSESLAMKLENIFSRVVYFQGIYPKELNTFRAKIRNYPIIEKEMRRFMSSPYERLFVICDTIYPELRCMQLAYQLNSKTHFYWLEDGILAYYSNVNINKGLTSNCVLKLIRRIYFKYYKALGAFYERDFPNFGGSKFISGIYCLYPEIVKELYKKQRELIQIENTEYLIGLKALYEIRSLPVEGGDIILLMDKLDTYLYPEKVKSAISAFVNRNRAAGKKIYCKYHPREDESWDELSECINLDRTIGVENIYCSLSDKAQNIEIVGIKSAGLMSAKILGFNTASLFLKSGENNTELISFYNKIGITIL